MGETVTVWIWAILSDLLQTRWTLLVAQGKFQITSVILLSCESRPPLLIRMTQA